MQFLQNVSTSAASAGVFDTAKTRSRHHAAFAADYSSSSCTAGSIDPQGGDDRPARETRALASCRLSPAHANRRSADKSLYLIVFAYDPQPRTNARLV